jgi:hypothetical protein
MEKIQNTPLGERRGDRRGAGLLSVITFKPARLNLRHEFASRCTRQRMGSGLSKLQKLGTPNRLASFTSGAPSTCFENTASNHEEPPVRSDAATSVQTRRELLVELEQARQQIMQQVLSRCLPLTNIEY